jgi:hypothetical protein
VELLNPLEDQLPLDICDPTGVFLSNADRQPLVRHGLLVPYGPKHRAFEVQLTWA